MKKIFHLSFCEFKNIYYKKPTLIFVFLSFIFILISKLISETTAIHAEKIYWDLNLGFAFLLSTLLSIFSSTFLVHNELESENYLMLLRLKFSEKNWLLAQHLCCHILSLTFLLSWLGLSFLFKTDSSSKILLDAGVAVYGLFLHTCLVNALCIFTTLSKKFFPAMILSALLIFFLLSLPQFTQNSSESLTSTLFNFLQRLLPSLELFNFRDFVAYETPQLFQKTLMATFHCFAWCLFFFFLSYKRLRNHFKLRQRCR